MLRKLYNSLRVYFYSNLKSANKITCYHCGEKSTPSQTIYVDFENVNRPVCCNGCAAILKTVEELGMCEEYHAQKLQMTYPNEQ